MHYCPAYLKLFLIHTLRCITVMTFVVLPLAQLTAQDEEYEDPTEVFWGDEEQQEYSEEEEYIEEDTSEYYEEEYYGEEEYYEEDNSEYTEEEYYEEEPTEESADLSETELSDIAKRLGYSMNISGASPGFVNHDMNSYNNNPQVNFRLSVEFPLLMQILGVRFRFGAEVGNFGFENYLPVGGTFSGITAMGLLAFPAGPGKLKIGAGLIGNTFGVSGETSYGFALGNTLEIRGGVRYTGAMNVVDDKNNDIGFASWVDGLVMLGFNL